MAQRYVFFNIKKPINGVIIINIVLLVIGFLSRID